MCRCSAHSARSGLPPHYSVHSVQSVQGEWCAERYCLERHLRRGIDVQTWRGEYPDSSGAHRRAESAEDRRMEFAGPRRCAVRRLVLSAKTG
jgi:hypothetical protein